MSIRVTCPQCQQTFKVKDEYSGRRGKCPGCGNSVRVPGEKIGTQPPADAPAAPPAAAPAPAEANPFTFDAAAPAPAEAKSEPPPRPKNKSMMQAQSGLPEPPAPARQPEPLPKPKKKLPTTTVQPSLPEPAPAVPAADNPFAFEAGPGTTPPPPRVPADPAPTPAATEGSNPFGFTAAAPANVEKAPEPRSRKKSAGRPERARHDADDADEADRPADRDDEEAPRAGGRVREGTWADVAAGCQWVRIGAIVVGSAALAVLILTNLSAQAASTFYLIALIAATVGYGLGTLGRKSATLAPDPVFRNHASVSLILSLVTAGVLGLSVLLNILLVAGLAGRGFLSVLFLVAAAAFVCGALAEVFFARALMRVAVEHRHPPLGTWALTIFIGAAATGGTFALGALIVLLSSAGGGFGGLGIGALFMQLAEVAVIVFAALYNVPLIQAKGLLLGTWKPEARTHRRGRDEDKDDEEEELEPAEKEEPKAGERAAPPAEPASAEPFAFGDEGPDDRDDGGRGRPRRR